MKAVLLLGSLLLLSLELSGQVTQPTPGPAATPPRVVPVRTGRVEGPGTLASGPASPLEFKLMLLEIYAEPLYRRPDKREMQVLAVDPKIDQGFKSLLTQSNTGTFRLIADLGCAEHVQVVNASEACRKYSMPGAGSSFSFRIGTHRLKRLSDLALVGGRFTVPGVLMQGIVVGLGDVPIENFTLTSPGIDFLSEFKPPEDLKTAAATDRLFVGGVWHRGFRYARSARAEINSTYAIRSVAFRGTVNRATHGVTYNELEYDKRCDVIVVFRVVDRDTDGNLTIVWRELRNIEAPRIK